MFQEIREFRSFAYQVNARLKHPPLNRSEKPASFVMKLATQTDKMIDAMEVLEIWCMICRNVRNGWSR